MDRCQGEKPLKVSVFTTTYENSKSSRYAWGWWDNELPRHAPFDVAPRSFDVSQPALIVLGEFRPLSDVRPLVAA